MRQEYVAAEGSRNVPQYAEYHGLADVPSHYLREVEHFFEIYKELEGVRTTALGWKPLDRARQVILDCVRLYANYRTPPSA